MSSSITNPDVEQYIRDLLDASDPLLLRMEEEAARRAIPIVGPLVGRFLYILARARRAKDVLEIGTATGYSAIWLGRAVKKERGKVLSIEIDAVLAREAERNIKSANLSDNVKVSIGDGAKVARELKENFDMIFIDAGQKELYVKLFKLCLPLLRPGGLLIADNALWGGSVASEDESVEATTLRTYNKLASTNPNLKTVVLPLRDGVAISLKE